MKVSVIIPAYNAEKTIERCINSVIMQTMRDFEIIIINDGSLDKTKEKCEKYEKKYKYITLYNQENKGVSSARNMGIRKANGEYIMFIDSDDEYKMNMLEKMSDNIRESDLVICNIERKNNNVINSEIYKDKEEIKKKFNQIFESGLVNSIFNKIYKRDILEKNNIFFDENSNLGEDLQFNLNYISNINKLIVIDDILYKYHEEDSYLTKKYRKDMFQQRKKMIVSTEKFFEKNNIIDEYTDFAYVKLVYACTMQFFHKENTEKWSEKKNYMRIWINDVNVRKSLKSKRKKHSIKEKVLRDILKTRRVTLIYIVSGILDYILKRGPVVNKGVSI